MADASPITCPGCRKPLLVAPEAWGKPAHCPHCRANFFLQLSPDGSPGQPVAQIRPGGRIPKLLLAPAFALVVLGLAGVFVNGYLFTLFLTKPGAELETAKSWIMQVRSTTAETPKPDSEWEHAPRAALAGGAMAIQTADVAETLRDVELAQAMVDTGYLVPVHAGSAALGLLSLAGGIAAIRGRWYPLALLGCIAAILNVNHLCCVPGGIAGVWGILVLVRDEGRAYFKR